MTLLLSWSGLKRYEACHQLHLRTIKKQTTPPNARVFLAGACADLVQREWLNQEDPKPGQMVTAIPDVLDRLTNSERNFEDYRSHIRWRVDRATDLRDISGFVKLVVTKLEPILLKHVVPYDYEPELKFRTTLGIPYLDDKPVGVLLLGGIDIVVRLPDGRFVLYDLKATKERRYIDSTLGQGIFYDIAWASYFGEGYPAMFGFIAPALDDPLIWVKVSDEDRQVMFSRITAFAHGMWRGDWKPKTDDAGCNFCEAKHACDKFAVHLKLDEVGRHRASFEQTVTRRRELRLASSVPEGDV
jgi:PD-(D/E)XK nuclease superfamily protein